MRTWGQKDNTDETAPKQNGDGLDPSNENQVKLSEPVRVGEGSADKKDAVSTSSIDAEACGLQSNEQDEERDKVGRKVELVDQPVEVAAVADAGDVHNVAIEDASTVSVAADLFPETLEKAFHVAIVLNGQAQKPVHTVKALRPACIRADLSKSILDCQPPEEFRIKRE